MRACDPPIHYLVGTPKGRLSKLEAELLGLDWQLAREGVEVKLLSLTGELYVLARSRERMAKERAMRRRQLKKLWARLAELQRMAPARDTLLLKLGAAKSQYPAAWRLIEVQVAQDGTLGFWLRKDKLREVCRREGRYLLRSNLCAEDPAQIWQLYILLTQIEEAFKTLKGDLAVRPIFTARRTALKPIFSWPSWPFVSTPPCVKSCGSKPPVSPRARSSSNSMPCKCSTSTSRLPMDAP